MDRYEEILEAVVASTSAAVDQFQVDQFDFLVRHSGVSPRRFQEEFRSHMRHKVRRDTAAELQALGLPESLREVEAAERAASVRREAFLAAGGKVRPEEAPVHLAQLSTQQLIDCQLRGPREQWIEELRSRLSDAERARADLTREVEARRAALQDRLARIERRVAALDAAAATMDLDNIIADTTN